MARVAKAKPSLETLMFQTPEQKVLRLLLTESTTTFSPRVISSRLKGVRGMGGASGLLAILEKLEELGFVDFVNNRREVRLHDENATAHLLKRVSAVCDLETLKELLQPVSSRGVLYNSRATGKSRSDSDYDVFVVTTQPDEVQHVAERHPLGKLLKVLCWTPDEFTHLQERDPKLAGKLDRGIVLWGWV